MHIAFALNKPVICFNTSIRCHPFGKHDISIDRIPKHIKNNRRLTGDDVEEALKNISVDDVIIKAQPLIS